MNRKGKFLISRSDAWFVLWIVCLIMGASSSGWAQGPPPAKVVVSIAKEDQIREEVNLIGTAESLRASTVASEIAGRVASLEVRRGQVVRKGEVLADLDKSDLPFRLQEARGKRKATGFRLERAQDILDRSEKLMEDQAISEKDLKQARLTVGELEGDLAAIEAEIRLLEDEAERKTIRAPFDGVVTRELTEVGQWVDKGGEIVHLVDLSTVRIVVDVPQKYVPGIRADDEVIVTVDALGQAPIPGRVHALIPEGNKDSRVFPLEIRVKNDTLRIKEGMLVRATFRLGLPRRVLMVHKDAVITRGSQTFVFIVNHDSAKEMPVATGVARGEWIEVKGPLKSGDRVVVRGNERLRNGQPVEIISTKD